MTSMRDTQTNRVIRIGHSRRALRIRDDACLKRGGSVTAWPLLAVCADTRMAWLAAWRVFKTRSPHVSIFSP